MILSQHPVLRRAAILNDLEVLLVRCRSEAGGISPQHLRNVCEHLVKALEVALRPSQSGPAELFLASDTTDPEQLLHAICRHMQARTLTACLIGVPAARIAMLYEDFGFLAVADDRDSLLQLMHAFESLPILTPSLAGPGEIRSAESPPHLLHAKNNVRMCRGDKFATGYLAVTTTDPKAADAFVDREHCPQTANLSLSWTPNAHFSSPALALIESEGSLLQAGADSAPLPAGWDQGYDPVTGHHYYINHKERRTSWSDPRTRRTSSTSSTFSQPSPAKIEQQWPECRCSAEEKHTFGNANYAQACSVLINATLAEPMAVSIHRNMTAPNEDCGTISIQGPKLCASGFAFELAFESGGLRALESVFRSSAACSVEASSDAALPRASTASLGGGTRTPPLSRRIVHARNASLARLETPPDDADSQAAPNSSSAPPATIASEPSDDAASSTSLTLEIWATLLDSEGRLADWETFRKLVFFRGIAPSARKELWGILLGLYPCDATAAQRQEIYANNVADYLRLKSAWYAMPVGRAADVRALLRTVSKDVVRTDRDHALLAGDANPHLTMLLDVLVTASLQLGCFGGYVQGMSDLCAPFLHVCQDEAYVYMCFMSQMKRLAGNFAGDGLAMHLQLDLLRELIQVSFPAFFQFLSERDLVGMFFSYRWLLLEFKREFIFEDTHPVWEAIWSEHRSDKIVFFVALAVVEVHGLALLDKSSARHPRPLQTDQVLEYFSALSQHMDVQKILRTMRASLYRFYARETAIPLSESLWQRLFPAT